MRRGVQQQQRAARDSEEFILHFNVFDLRVVVIKHLPDDRSFFSCHMNEKKSFFT